MEEKYLIENLLPDYFSGEINDADRIKIEFWKNESIENKKYFDEMAVVWNSGAILEGMQQFNSGEALKKINSRLSQKNFNSHQFVKKLQKIAAILILPLLIYSSYLTIQQISNSNLTSDSSIQKVKTSTGLISELTLPDGTHVWLNSESTLEYPMNFSKVREVKLQGEAFFDVTKDQNRPFVVNTGKINVEVLGTSFDVVSYSEDSQTEVALKSGKVKLFAGEYEHKTELGFLTPDQRATYDHTSRELNIKNVSIEKYHAWKDGIIMFDDDPMVEVTRKLSRWFNVDFILESPELRDYVYRATFKNESLDQVLELLKISAPIDFEIIPRETLSDGNYSKKKVLIKKRQI